MPKARVNPPDLESEAREATTPEARVALIVRLLGSGEWVHGVHAFTLAAIWGSSPDETLELYDRAMGLFAEVPGSADALRGLGFARLTHLADRALRNMRTVVIKRDGEEEAITVPEPRYAEAIKATQAAYELALKGDPEGAGASEEVDAMLRKLGLDLEEARKRLV